MFLWLWSRPEQGYLAREGPRPRLASQPTGVLVGLQLDPSVGSYVSALSLWLREGYSVSPLASSMDVSAGTPVSPLENILMTEHVSLFQGTLIYGTTIRNLLLNI